MKPGRFSRRPRRFRRAQRRRGTTLTMESACCGPNDDTSWPLKRGLPRDRSDSLIVSTSSPAFWNSMMRKAGTFSRGRLDPAWNALPVHVTDGVDSGRVSKPYDASRSKPATTRPDRVAGFVSCVDLQGQAGTFEGPERGCAVTLRLRFTHGTLRHRRSGKAERETARRRLLGPARYKE